MSLNPTAISALTVYTPEQAAEILQCTASWLREQARLRKIPHTLIGGRIGLTDQHLTEIIAQHERRPEAAAPAKIVRRRTGDAEPTGVTPLRARRPQRARRSA